MNRPAPAPAYSKGHHPPRHSPTEGLGMLLALDGRCVEQLALPVAVQLCHGSSHRLDILIANPPKAATSMLGSFLMELERHGVDYRLTSTERVLHEELVHYVHRFRYVSVILLDCIEHWDEDGDPTLATLRREGYRVISLLDHREGGSTAFLDANWKELT